MEFIVTFLFYAFLGCMFEGIREVYFNPFGLVMLAMGSFIILYGCHKSVFKSQTANLFLFFFAVVSLGAPFCVALMNNGGVRKDIGTGAIIVVLFCICAFFLSFAYIYVNAWMPTYEAQQNKQAKEEGSQVYNPFDRNQRENLKRNKNNAENQKNYDPF